MKDLVIIDVRQCVLTHTYSSFDQGLALLVNFLNSCHKHKLQPNFEFHHWYTHIGREYKFSNNIRSDLLSLLKTIFEPEENINDIASHCIESIKSWTNKERPCHLFFASPWFDTKRLTKMLDEFDVMFVHRTKNPLKEFFMRLSLSLYSIDNHLVRLDSDQFKNTIAKFGNQHIYVVSSRPQWAKTNIIEAHSIKEFDFRHRFIYYTNTYLVPKKREDTDKQANELGVFWDLMSLQFLQSKLKMAQKIASKLIDEKDLRFFGICIDRNYFERGFDLELFHDGSNIVFTFHDPLAFRHRVLDIRFIRLPYIFMLHEITSYEAMLETCKKLQQAFHAEDIRRGMKSIDIIDPRYFEPYFHRRKMLEMFQSTFDSAQFKAMLAERKINANILTPKSIYSTSKKIDEVD